MKLSDKEKEEFRSLSVELSNDLRIVAQNRHNPVMVNGEVDMDRLLTLSQRVQFIFQPPAQTIPLRRSRGRCRAPQDRGRARTALC